MTYRPRGQLAFFLFLQSVDFTKYIFSVSQEDKASRSS